jgi:hypothetical protein
MFNKTREQLGAAQRWVVKIGSAMITNDGQGLDNFSIDAWVAQMAELHHAGRELLLVTSGAVAEGMRRLGWSPSGRPRCPICKRRRRWGRWDWCKPGSRRSSATASAPRKSC